ncbi:MAG: type III ribulose-bisphosphate carboxylase [Nanoarchaeota archaeon]|nr:type III ribulose-bisphosphate carboxylase [Nanoarchaeota archaeon]MBU4086150.1 type III ribulose-bisphosphate carboxylase [Nanoarchaeota archaeon]
MKKRVKRKISKKNYESEVEYEYLKLSYHPKDDIICLFRIEPAAGITLKKAAEHVALESSIGTWTSVPGKSYMRHLAAKIFSIEGNLVKIAYPSQLFEHGNAPNILSSIAGNIFGMKAVKNLRLEDVSFPKSILKGFMGPGLGISGIRKELQVYDRPFLGTIVKPKLGLNSRDHAHCAYEAWLGGCDFVKDDENLSSQTFNLFERRLALTLEAKDRAEQETGEKKAYLVNVTAETNEMIKRAELVKKMGAKFCMVDVLTAGFAALQTLRQANLKLGIHGHRAMHAAMTRNKKHGISMMTLADFSRLIGVDSLHIGTGIGKLEGSAEEIREIEEEIENEKVKETQLRLKQDWGRIKPTLGVCSGGLHPGHIPFLVRHFGKDISIQLGGGIHGHPQGTSSGAIAARQAIDAAIAGISLEKYSEKYPELKHALKLWMR